MYDLEEWIITTLAAFGVEGERRNGRVGIWVKHNVEDSPDLREDKIAAIGVRVRRWVTFHGISINLEPDLDHYSGIIPCGISDFGTTSLKALGISISMDDLDCALQRSFRRRFRAQNIQSVRLKIVTLLGDSTVDRGKSTGLS